MFVKDADYFGNLKIKLAPPNTKIATNENANHAQPCAHLELTPHRRLPPSKLQTPNSRHQTTKRPNSKYQTKPVQRAFESQDCSFTDVCLDGSGNQYAYMKLHSSMNVSECQQYCSNMPRSEDQVDFSVSTKLNLCRCDYEAGTLPSAESFPSDVISAPPAYTQGSGRVMSGNGNVDWKCYPIQSRNLIVKSDFTVSVFVLLFL